MAAERWIDTYGGRIRIALTFLGLVLGLAVWQYPKMMMKDGGSPPMYQLRVQVKSLAGDVLRNSAVRVSTGNERQQLTDDYWQIAIPSAKVPADGKITVTAEHDDWAMADKEVLLGDDPNPSTEIRLPPRPPSLLVGTVFDAEDHGVPGARVCVMGHSVEVVETDATLAMVKRYAHLTEGHTASVIARMAESCIAA